MGLFLLPLLPQKLLEECEQNWEKVEECHRLAKQYIDAIKVRGGEVGLLEGLALQAGLPRLGSSSRPTPLSFEGLRTSAGHVQSPGGARLFSCQEGQSAVCLGQHHPGGEGLSLGGGSQEWGQRSQKESLMRRKGCPMGRRALLGTLGQSWGGGLASGVAAAASLETRVLQRAGVPELLGSFQVSPPGDFAHGFQRASSAWEEQAIRADLSPLPPPFWPCSMLTCGLNIAS